MSYNTSVSLIIPTEHADSADRLSCALGRAPYDAGAGEPIARTFVATLSTDGTPPATHFGCHAYTLPSFTETLDAAQSGELPDLPWSDFGLAEDDVHAVMQAMTVVHEVGDVSDTWPKAKEQAGVQSVVEEPDDGI